LLLVSFLIGLILSAILIRNRFYFVVVARYVNELRDMLSGGAWLDFKSKSGIPKEFPPYWNPLSSHTLAFYLLSILNSSLFSGIIYIGWIDAKRVLLWVIFVVFGLSVSQITVAMLYLKSKEKRKTEVWIETRF
jgi:hypothetical protein